MFLSKGKEKLNSSQSRKLSSNNVQVDTTDLPQSILEDEKTFPSNIQAPQPDENLISVKGVPGDPIVMISNQTVAYVTPLLNNEDYNRNVIRFISTSESTPVFIPVTIILYSSTTITPIDNNVHCSQSLADYLQVNCQELVVHEVYNKFNPELNQFDVFFDTGISTPKLNHEGFLSFIRKNLTSDNFTDDCIKITSDDSTREITSLNSKIDLLKSENLKLKQQVKASQEETSKVHKRTRTLSSENQELRSILTAEPDLQDKTLLYCSLIFQFLSQAKAREYATKSVDKLVKGFNKIISSLQPESLTPNNIWDVNNDEQGTIATNLLRSLFFCHNVEEQEKIKELVIHKCSLSQHCVFNLFNHTTNDEKLSLIPYKDILTDSFSLSILEKYIKMQETDCLLSALAFMSPEKPEESITSPLTLLSKYLNYYNQLKWIADPNDLD